MDEQRNAAMDSKLIQKILPNAVDDPGKMNSLIGKDIAADVHGSIALQCSSVTGFDLCLFMNILNILCFLCMYRMIKYREVRSFLGDKACYVKKISFAQCVNSTVATLIAYWLTHIVAEREDVEMQYFTLMELRYPIIIASFMTVVICLIRFMSYLVATSDFYTGMINTNPFEAPTKKISKKRSSKPKREIVVAAAPTPFMEKKSEGALSALMQFCLYGMATAACIALIFSNVLPATVMSHIEKFNICIPSEILSDHYRYILIFFMVVTFNVCVVMSEKSFREHVKANEPFGAILATPFTTTTSGSSTMGWIGLLFGMYYFLNSPAMQCVIMWELVSLFDAGWMMLLSFSLYTTNKSLNIPGIKVQGIP